MTDATNDREKVRRLLADIAGQCRDKHLDRWEDEDELLARLSTWIGKFEFLLDDASQLRIQIEQCELLVEIASQRMENARDKSNRFISAECELQASSEYLSCVKQQLDSMSRSAEIVLKNIDSAKAELGQIIGADTCTLPARARDLLQLALQHLQQLETNGLTSSGGRQWHQLVSSWVQDLDNFSDNDISSLAIYSDLFEMHDEGSSTARSTETE